MVAWFKLKTHHHKNMTYWGSSMYYIAHVIIIIKLEVSTISIVVIFFRGCVPEMFVTSYILSLIAYTFRENRDFVFIVIAQFMIGANSGIRFAFQSVFVCSNIASSHYHYIFSVLRYTIYGAVCFQFTHFLCDDWENRKYELLYLV